MKDEEEISRMLASLKAVDAPEDFEGGVRSKIAERRDSSAAWRPGFILVAKFALPMLLLVAVGGYLIFSDERQLSRDMVPPVVDGTHEVADVEGAQTGPSGIANSSSGTSKIAQVQVNRGGGMVSSTPQGRSVDEQALTQDNSTVFPDGVDPRKVGRTNLKPPPEGSISPADVLVMVGVSSNCSQNGCLVTVVRDGSIASAAGIQSGDLISAINGRPISAHLIQGRFSVSEITLVRAGQKTTIAIGRP